MQLEINGAKYGLQWGTRAFILCERKMQIGLNEIILRAGEMDVICTLTYCAMQNWFELKDRTNTLPFSYDDFLIWLDDQPQDTAKLIEESFLESMLQGKSMKDRYELMNDLFKISNPDDGTPVKKKKLPSQKS